MELTINGSVRQIDAGTTIADLVLEQAKTTEGVAVAVNGEIVHRGLWQQSVLTGGQDVELITAMQGG